MHLHISGSGFKTIERVLLKLNRPTRLFFCQCTVKLNISNTHLQTI